MSALSGPTASRPVLPRPAAVDRVLIGVGVAALVLVVLAVAGVPPVYLLAPGAIGLAFTASHRTLMRWTTITGVIIGVVMLIPIKRYVLPGNLPFQLEPYRIMVAVVGLMWVGALLVEPRVRARRAGVEGPVMLLGFAILASVAVNVGHINALGVDTIVVKKLTFFASFFLIMWIVTSVLVRRVDIDTIIKVLVVITAGVGLSILVESHTQFNIFNHLIIPGVKFNPSGVPGFNIFDSRGARAYGSGEHPIASGAALMMVMPLAVHLAMQKGATRKWWVVVAILVAAALATKSRTAVVILLAELFLLVRLQPSIRKKWPLILPALVAIHLVVPGALGTMKNAFFPEGGLVSQQQSGKGTYGSGRLADLGPGLAEWSHHPVFGAGFGTRVTEDNDPLYNADILDDQWLGSLLEIGAVGVFALLWLFTRAVRAMCRRARAETGERSWLPTALGASILGYAVGMATFDSFYFIQVTLLLFLLMGIAGAERQTSTWRR